MSGKAKYCEQCKGYGGLYVQVIKRYGDDRIKERHPEKPAKEPCEPCKGTGMLSVITDKVPVFDVDVPSEAPEPTEDDLADEMEEILADQKATEDEMVGEVVDEDDPVVFEETRIEDEEMPL